MDEEDIWQENPQAVRDAEWERISSGFTNVRTEYPPLTDLFIERVNYRPDTVKESRLEKSQPSKLGLTKASQK